MQSFSQLSLASLSWARLLHQANMASYHPSTNQSLATAAAARYTTTISTEMLVCATQARASLWLSVLVVGER